MGHFKAPNQSPLQIKVILCGNTLLIASLKTLCNMYKPQV